MVSVNASWFYILERPKRCAKRLYLACRGVAGAEPSPYEQILMDLGRRYEESHLEEVRPVIDLREGDMDSRLARTRAALEEGVRTLYQPLLSIELEEATVSGSPDFLFPVSDGWVIRDVKINRGLESYPHIPAQLRLYGALLEAMTGCPPVRLEVLLGSGQLQNVPYDGLSSALNHVQELLVMATHSPGYEPVGWSKCTGCPYSDRCWEEAVPANDVAILPGVDQGLARVLHDLECGTIQSLLKEFDAATLADLKRPWGSREQRVGRKADVILRQARAFASNAEILVAPPQLPNASNVVMFDVEALPPHLDELDRVFLWGVKVYGENPWDYSGAFAFPGELDDQATLFCFLKQRKRFLKPTEAFRSFTTPPTRRPS